MRRWFKCLMMIIRVRCERGPKPDMVGKGKLNGLQEDPR